MKFLVNFPFDTTCSRNELSSPIITKDFVEICLPEFLFYIYNQFKLQKNDAEILLPDWGTADIISMLEITNVCDSEQSDDELGKFLRRCNLVKFDDILHRINKKEEIRNIFMKDVVVCVNSYKVSNFEKQFLEFFLNLNHNNVLDNSNFVEKTFDNPEILEINNNEQRVLENDVARIIISYLAVTVNWSDQFHFSYIFNIPDRNLNHHAFTHLRHQAESSSLSIPQFALSYVDRLKLGGKSYAPAIDCPLNKYSGGICQLVEMLNKLQSVMEDNVDNPDKVAIVGKMIRIVEICLLKDKNNRYKPRAVQTIKERIMGNLQKILSWKWYYPVTDRRQPLKSITHLVQHLIADYSIHPENYLDTNEESSTRLTSSQRFLMKTPQGGCSRDICLLYLSPETIDSPFTLSKQKVQSNCDTIECLDDNIGTVSMPAWPLYAKYQSDLGWARNDMTPPHIVQQQAADALKCITFPDLDGELSEEDNASVLSIEKINVNKKPMLKENGGTKRKTLSPKESNLRNQELTVGKKRLSAQSLLSNGKKQKDTEDTNMKSKTLNSMNKCTLKNTESSMDKKVLLTSSKAKKSLKKQQKLDTNQILITSFFKK